MLPPYAPELDPIETVWAYLRANRLAISVFETYDEIVTQRCDAWNFFASHIEAVKSITSREYAKAVKGSGRWYQTTEEFAAAQPFDKTEWAHPLELPDGSAPTPIAHAAE